MSSPIWTETVSESRRSVDERVARGRAARTTAPRSSQGGFVAAADRGDPISWLETQGASRVAELLPIRYARMAASPFAYFRGAALAMANDLAGTPTSGLTVQLGGDAHLSNFGLFASAERQLIFDINDFDETLPGPWEWDLKRLAASVQIAGHSLGFTDTNLRTIVTSTAARYRTAMVEFAGLSNLAVWHSAIPAEPHLASTRNDLDSGTAKLAAKTIAKAKRRDHLQAQAKLVQHDGERSRFVSDPPLLVRLDELATPVGAPDMTDRLTVAFGHYRESLSADRRSLLDQYEPVDIARKVVGVGSVGTQAWLMLLIGRDAADPLLLQIKEAQLSVLEQFLEPSVYDNAGHRVVVGQRTMQASTDILLGWHQLVGSDDVLRDFYVRQFRDWKGSVEVELMSPTALAYYGALCAWTLARAHARSGDRIAIAAYLGSGPGFDRAIADFAIAYAEQNLQDYQVMLAAVASGRLPTHDA
jgi:uncharacterized protein (DUF2252 family)